MDVDARLREREALAHHADDDVRPPRRASYDFPMNGGSARNRLDQNACVRITFSRARRADRRRRRIRVRLSGPHAERREEVRRNRADVDPLGAVRCVCGGCSGWERIRRAD